MDDQDRFLAETSEEAHYWFTVADFVELSLNVGLDKMLEDVIQLRGNKLKETA
jgi:hypothetical protein